MIKQNTQHSHRLALLIALVVTAGLMALVAVFGSAVYQNYIEAESDRLVVASDQAKESSLVAIKELTKETTASKDSLASFVITKDNLAKFTDLIEEVGGKRGATTSVVSANELGGVVGKKKIVLAGWRLELRLEGSFDQVWQGLKLIEVLPVAKRVTKVSLVRAIASNETGSVNWVGGLVIELPSI